MSERLPVKRFPSLELLTPCIFPELPVYEHELKITYEPPENRYAANLVLNFSEQPASRDSSRRAKWTTDRESLIAAMTSEPGTVVPDSLGNIRYTRVTIPNNASIAGVQGFGATALSALRRAVGGPQAEPSTEYLRLDCYGDDKPANIDRPTFHTFIPFNRLYSFVYGTLLDEQPDAVREPNAAAFYHEAFVRTAPNPKDPYLP